MAMIFVHDYEVHRKRNKRYVIWAIPCRSNLPEESLKRLLKKAICASYCCFNFKDATGRKLSARKVADAVVEFAFENHRTFWEFNEKPDYVVVVPRKYSMRCITDGLLDIECDVMRANKWTY